MAKIERAYINPMILVWARVQSGLDLRESARKAGITEERLDSWERGDALPTLRQLRSLARIYKRPSAFFYLSEPPAVPPSIPDFRKVPNRLPKMPPEFRHEIRRARFRREVALDIFQELGETRALFDLEIDIDDAIPKSASKVRNYLGISTKEQVTWREPYKALKKWIEGTESKGVLVFQFGEIDVGISRGFSINEKPLPIISLNGADTPRARIFTLLHEIVHLGLGSGAICDLREANTGEDLEVFCNTVAAEALVPQNDLLLHDVVQANRGNEIWSDRALNNLSIHFSVSREVILLCFIILLLTTRYFYKLKRQEFKEEYEEINVNKRGFMWYHKRIVRDNGPAYTGLLVDAYQQKAISAMEFSRFLGDISLTHLNSIRDEVRS